MDDETGERVIDLKRAFRLPGGRLPTPGEVLDGPKDWLPEPEKPPAAPAKAPSPGAAPPPAGDDGAAVAPEQLAPRPRPGDPYAEAHSRLANRPLVTIFFLGEGQLPDGFAYHQLERVRLVEGERPGDGPALCLRFAGSAVHDVRIEGRNLLGLCDYLGRHLVHWVRQHPAGRDDSALTVCVRRITIREVER